MFFGFFSSAGRSGVLRRIKMWSSRIFSVVVGAEMDVVQIFPSFVSSTYTVIVFLIFTETNQLEV